MNIQNKGTLHNAPRRRTVAEAGCALLLAAAFAVGAGNAQAQTNGSNSPYSRYGFGLLSDGGQGFNRGMSGLSYGMRNGAELNSKNPASYSAIDSLSFLFDAGFTLQNANLEANGRKINARNTSFDYLTMGFRATRNLGISLGLLPFSTIGYSMSNDETLEDNTGEITQTESYSGDGGLHEAYLGVGWSPFKNFSIGANVGYLWGDMTHTVMASFSDADIASRRRQYTADIRTYKVDFGLQYVQRLNKKNTLTLGLTYGLGHDINSNSLYYDQLIYNNTVSGDTLVARNAYGLPHTFGVGLAWNHDNRLRVGADYTLQKWQDVKSPQLSRNDLTGASIYEARTGGFTDMHKFVVGFEYINNPNGVRWRDLIRYRAGFAYTSPYTRVDGQDGPRDYQVSLGVALPIINFYNNRSLLNISAQYERVKPKVAGMITENYLRISIGLSFNERWFMKWKVE